MTARIELLIEHTVDVSFVRPFIAAIRRELGDLDDVERTGDLLARAVIQNAAARSAVDCALHDLASVNAHVQTPILADESVWTGHDLAEIVRRRAASLVNIKLSKSGGLTEARRMVRLADEHDVGVLIGGVLESHVGIAAAPSLAASLGETHRERAHDLDAGLCLAPSPVVSGAHYIVNDVVLSRDAGTGIAGLASTGATSTGAEGSSR